MLILGILILMLTAFLANRYFKNKRFNHLLKQLPSPPGVPLLGHARMFSRKGELLDTITKHLNEQNGVALYRVGPLVNYFAVADHELVKILCTNKNVQKSSEYKTFERWLGECMFTLEGDRWKKHRTIATPGFHLKVLEQFVNTFNSVSDVFIDRLRDKVDETIDVYPYVNLCALDVIAETAMGVSLNAQRSSQTEYVQSVQDILRIMEYRLFSPIMKIDWIFRLSSNYTKEQKALRVLKDQTNSIIQSKIKTLSDETSCDGINGNQKNEKRQALLDILLKQRGTQMSDQDISNTVEEIMFAGHDTVASATACLLYLLSRHIHVQQKIVDELVDIYGDDKERPCTFKDLQNMRYLEMVIKEGLRLYPPGVALGKQLTEDIEYNGYILPKGLTAIIIAYSMHRREKYFPNPNEFDPERFSPENQDNIELFSYIPFSAGPRVCLGQKFAMLEMKMIVSKLLRNYELLPVEGFEMKVVPEIVLRPSANGTQVKLKQRGN